MVDVLSLNSLCQFSCHAWVHLNGSHAFSCFKNPDSKVTCTRANFKDSISGTKVGLYILSIHSADDVN